MARANVLNGKDAEMRWIEAKTFFIWLWQGVIQVTDVGEENMYGIDEFANCYVAKHEN